MASEERDKLVLSDADDDVCEAYEANVERYRSGGRRRAVQLLRDVVVKPSVESIFDHAETALFAQMSRLSSKAQGPEGLDPQDAIQLAKLIDALTKVSREGRLRDAQLGNDINSLTAEELKREAALIIGEEEE